MDQCFFFGGGFCIKNKKRKKSDFFAGPFWGVWGPGGQGGRIGRQNREVEQGGRIGRQNRKVEQGGRIGVAPGLPRLMFFFQRFFVLRIRKEKRRFFLQGAFGGSGGLGARGVEQGGRIGRQNREVEQGGEIGRWNKEAEQGSPQGSPG